MHLISQLGEPREPRVDGVFHACHYAPPLPVVQAYAPVCLDSRDVIDVEIDDWADEPPAHRIGGHNGNSSEAWERIAAELRDPARARTWARLRIVGGRRDASATAAAINSGALRAFRPPGAYEAVSRVSDDEPRVWVCYLAGGKRMQARRPRVAHPFDLTDTGEL